MTHPIYTVAQLSAKTIAQLKTIAQAKGITPEGNKSYKQTWIDAIVASQPVQVEAPKATCATCPHFQSFNEASGRGCCQLFPHLVVREHHPRTSDCDLVSEAFEGNNDDNINNAAQSIEQRFTTPEVQEELIAYIEEQANEIASETVTYLEISEIVTGDLPSEELRFEEDNTGYDYKAIYQGETIALIQQDPWSPSASNWEVCMGGEIFKVKDSEQAFQLVRDRVARWSHIPTAKKVARQLAVGDAVVMEGVVWEVVGLRSQVVSANRKNIYQIMFNLQLINKEGQRKALTPYSEMVFQVVEF